MKIAFIKLAGGIMSPASDIEAERMKRFKTGELFEIDIKNSRNADFHRKVFSFFNFCFEHWQDDREFLSHEAQFDRFRKELTIIAGYYNKVFTLSGELRLEPKSLSYSQMTQEDFEQFFHALISASMKHIFIESDTTVIDKLYSFMH